MTINHITINVPYKYNISSLVRVILLFKVIDKQDMKIKLFVIGLVTATAIVASIVSGNGIEQAFAGLTWSG